MRKLILILLSFLTYNLYSQCENAIEFNNQDCVQNINQSQFSIIYSFIPEQSTVIFDDAILLSNCIDLEKVFILLDENCDTVEVSNTSTFLNLIENNQYYLSINVQCQSGTIRTFCLFEQIILPIQLYSFEGYQKNNIIEIKWSTYSELNIDKIIIEHSINNVEWYPIYEIRSLGNTQNQTNYSTTHINPITGMNFYRIKTIDLNSSIAYSTTISVNFIKQQNNNSLKDFDLIGRRITMFNN